MLAFDQNSDPFGDIPITQPPRAPSRPPMLGQQQPLAGPPRQAPPQSPTNDAIDAERLRSLRLNNDAQQDTLDPGTVDMLAHQYILSGQLPPLGMGRSATASRQAILNRASSIAGVRSGESVQAGFARYRNGVAALHQQEGQLTAIRGNEAAALANGQQYIDRSAELPGQTRFSPLNAISNFVQRRAGGTTITQMDTAHDNFANESARVISGAPSGAGVLSDSARQQWMDVLNSDASIDQKRMALEQLRADMDNRVNALDSNIQQGYRNLESGRPVSSGDGQQRGPGSLGPAIVNSVQDLLAHGGQSGQMPPPGPSGSGPSSGGSPPPQQTGPIEFGARPQTPTGFEQQQVAAYDAFMQRNPHATAAQLRAAFPNVSNADDIIAFRDRHGIVAPGASWVMARPNAPAADITGSRGGSPAATNRAIMENTISQGVPLLGPAVSLDQSLRGPEAGNALLHGGQDWSSFGLRDEAGAGINTMAGNGSYDQNIANERGVDAYDSANHFGDRLAGQVTAGLPEAFLPGGMQAQMARGGAQGALYGFGSGEGGVAQRLPNALVGGVMGAAAPPLLAGAGQAVRAVAPRIGQAARFVAGRTRPNVTPEGQAVAQAGAAEKIPVSGPMLDPSTRSRMAYLESSLGSGGAVRGPLDATQAGIANRMGEIAGPGAVNERGAMGARVQAAARNFVTTSGNRIGAIYQRAAQMAGDTPVLGGNAVQRLDQHIAQLEQNAGQNAPVLNYLRTVRGDLVDENGVLRPKTVQAFRDMRTNLRGNIDQAGLTHTNADRIMADVLDGARQDINYFVGARNPEANRLYQQADQEWAGRHAEITQIVDRLVGRADNPLGGGTVMNKVQGLATGDVPRLRRVWAMLGPQERADLTATIASRAGYKSEDEPFSLQQFMVWQRTLPDSARQVIFGADGARSIRNLTVLTRALQETRSQLNNSRSGVVQNWRDTIKGFLGGNWGSLAAGGAGGYGSGSFAGGAAASALLTGAGMAMRRASARALMNPDLSAWLAGAARVGTPSAMRTQLGRLSAIASRNPAISQEITGLRDLMLRAVNDNPGMLNRAAAGDNPNQNQQQGR